MRRVVLALPVVWLAAASAAAETNGMDGFFGTLELSQPIAAAPPFFGLRAGAVRGHFGLEGGASAGPFLGMTELSVLGVFNRSGAPVLLRAGVTHVGDGVIWHAGASALSRGRRVRARFDYTYRWIPGYGGFSTLGLGLVVHIR